VTKVGTSNPDRTISLKRLQCVVENKHKLNLYERQLDFTDELLKTQTFICGTCKIKRKDKGKAIPLQAWAGPGGFRRMRLPDFKTIGT
jgi:hypothetical protein